MSIDQAIANTRAHLLSLRNAAGHWEGELSSSALSTATAVVALHTVDHGQHTVMIEGGARWLIANQNADGGWGDTTISKSNLSTTLLCVSALTLVDSQRAKRCPDEVANQSGPPLRCAGAIAKCDAWLREQVGSLEPDAIGKAVVARYGKDRTFSVPILMTCAICGRLGAHDEAWRRVLPLPFELAALPRTWFGAVGLPVVSYALPALIAIGHARFFHSPPAWWNPLRWLRAALWPRISPMLKTLQPSSGGYLEATPLTSFVTMALASAGEKEHPCVPQAVEFLRRSQREDGSWAIDTNLATWGTTLAVKALGDDIPADVRKSAKEWLLSQQYKVIHPFTNAAPGGWAWTDLPGGVPDADDTSGALIALWHLCESGEERREILPEVEAGITWLLDLQNRDGGMPTFCRGWGALPFDRSTPEITAHALWASALWAEHAPSSLRIRIRKALDSAQRYLSASQRNDGSWAPLWFGNEHVAGDENRVFGTAQVLEWLTRVGASDPVINNALTFLIRHQKSDGSWGGSVEAPSTIEETALAVSALCSTMDADTHEAIDRGVRWLAERTKNGTVFPAAPIGLYFAKLWYHEVMYPVIWVLRALNHAKFVKELHHSGPE